jgi:PncC family amidohydrolase
VNIPLEAQVGAYLRDRRLRLAVAESCTGGLLGHRLTNIPGSSDYFLGGVISYSYAAKASILGVSWETLKTQGAVNRETVLQMARGARKVFGADIAMSISGIAGPGGGSPHKPVGLTWIGLSASDLEEAWNYLWQGDRLRVKEQSVEQALHLLLGYLTGKTEKGDSQ